MSLVSTYVLADNGMFYQDPRLGSDDWFLCFDDKEPPEFVVADPKYYSSEAAFIEDARQMKAAVLLKQAIKNGLNLTLSHFNRHAIRCFPDFKNMRWASSWFVKVDKPIPVKLLQGDYTLYFLPQSQCVIVDFNNGEECYRRQKWEKLTKLIPHHLLREFCKSINDPKLTMSGEFLEFLNSDSGIKAFEEYHA